MTTATIITKTMMIISIVVIGDFFAGGGRGAGRVVTGGLYTVVTGGALKVVVSGTVDDVVYLG